MVRLKYLYISICLLGLSVFAHASFDLDIDDDGKTEALTDGLLVIRHLFGFSGDSLTANATGTDANRSDAASIEAHLVDNKSSLDVDGDGSVEALTDGLLIIRELFGFSGDSLITGAVSGSGTRVTGGSVVDYLKTIKDTDNDGYLDSVDAFVTDATEWVDTDSDGWGNNFDGDDDGDGVLDVSDAFPLDSTESLDTDSDGIGNNADTDDDGDGLSDDLELFPLDASVVATDISAIVDDVVMTHQFNELGEVILSISVDSSVKEVDFGFEARGRDCGPEKKGSVDVWGWTYERNDFLQVGSINLGRFAATCDYYLFALDYYWQGQRVFADLSAFAETITTTVDNPNADNDAPAPLSFEFGEPEYGADSILVPFSGTLKEEGSGTSLFRVRAREYNEGGAPRDETIPATLDSQTQERNAEQLGDGKWVGTLILPANASNGIYGANLTTWDNVGNSANFYGATLSSVGDNSFEISHTNADESFPMISRLVITPKKVEGSTVAIVDWQGSDDIRNIYFRLKNIVNGGDVDAAYLRDLNEATKTFTLDPYFCNGAIYEIRFLSIRDNSTNTTSLNQDDVVAAGLVPAVFTLTIPSEPLNQNCD